MRHLLEKGHPKEAAKYVARCDAPRSVDLYVMCGEWREAARECKERGDKGRIECVFLFHFGMRGMGRGDVM